MITKNNFDGYKRLPSAINRNFDANYRFVLRKYTGPSSKLRCPRCSGKSFTPYIDTKTNEILDETVGICDHKNSCGYHFSPHDFFEMFPHKKEEYFPKKDYNATNTNVKHHSNSVKHHPNTINNQQVRIHSNSINTAPPHGFAIITRAAANPGAGNAKEICAGNTKETYTIPKEIIKNKENGFNFMSHNLEMYMLKYFGHQAYDDIQRMFSRMIVKGDFEGGTLFYQIDLNGDIRTAKECAKE